MSFFKRLVSVDYRAALSAEAAGQLDQAAERYVLAGEHAEAVRVHLVRAQRAEDRSAEITALRDALHWAGGDPAQIKRINRWLGLALLARARAQGVATHRDKEQVREAAGMLLVGGDFEAAGDALESIGDHQAAASAYSRGGLVERMEAVLGHEEATYERQRTLRDASGNYHMHMRAGQRDAAQAALRRAISATDKPLEYRRLLDELESRLITGGVVVLAPRQGPSITVVGGHDLTLGRDPLCELPLRAGGISRQHAHIGVSSVSAASPRFHVRDLGSRNGTFVGGMRLDPDRTSEIPLTGQGSFALGEHCTISYQVAGTPEHLILRVQDGLDRDRTLIAGGGGELLDLGHGHGHGPGHDRGHGPGSGAGRGASGGAGLRPLIALPIAIEMQNGRPYLHRTRDNILIELCGEPIARGAIQLIHGDLLLIDGIEVEVA